MFTAAAAPRLVMNWERETKPSAAVGDRLVQLLKSYIEGFALWTPRLLVVANPCNCKFLWNRMIQNFLRGVPNLLVSFDLDPADKVGDEPFHPNHVVIRQKTFNPGGFERA